MWTAHCLLVVVLFVLPKCYLLYTIPSPDVEVLPRGFRVSIPDEPGVTLFGFHGKINKQFRGNEAGDFYLDVLRARQGVWAYENTRLQVFEGDVLYFWIYVQHDRLGYLLDNQEFEFNFRRTTTSSYDEDDVYYTQPPTVRTTTRTTTRNTPRTTTEQPDDSFDCEPSITTIKGNIVCSKELIFEETFSGNSLSKTWKNSVEMPLDTEDAEFVSYQNLPSICSVKDGNFNIFPKLLSEIPGFSADSIRSGILDFGARCTAIVNPQSECIRRAEHFTILPPVVSCKIQTKNSFSFKYGKVEIRAKFPTGDWLYPQLNLESSENSYGASGYSSGLLRVAFIRGNENLKIKNGEPIDGRKLSAGAILTSREKYRDLWMKSTLKENHFGDDFHIYQLLWTNQSITVAVDGVSYGTIEGGFRELAMTSNVTVSSQLYAGDYMAPFDKEFFLTLGVGVGGISDFPDLSQNGYGNFKKPWANTSPKAELRFWNDVQNWNSSWDRTKNGLLVDYIKVWSI